MNTTSLFPVERGRFTLSRLCTRHCPDLESLYRNHPVEVRLYSPQLSSQFAAAPETTVAQLIREQVNSAHQGLNLSCGILVKGQLVGQIDCAFDPETPTVIELGYWIIADLQQQGIMSEACELILSTALLTAT